MKKTAILLASLCLQGSTLLAAPAPASKPNIVFILADDLGWADTTLYGHTTYYHTPNIERLARRGMTFTRAYAASPYCSPTRSSILTGLSPARIGITTPCCHLPQVVLQATPGKFTGSGQKCVPPRLSSRVGRNPDYSQKGKIRRQGRSRRAVGLPSGSLAARLFPEILP